METSREVSLLVDGQTFKISKDVLCEYSDYFRAMFSGNYIENEKQEITIDVVDAASMEIILRYMKMEFIELPELSLSTIGEIAIAANFLQITELIKQIEYCLDFQLSPSNWVETMTIAENACYKRLEELSAAYGLYEFKLMKPEHIRSVHKLVWCLSHTHLNTESELQVFKFGLDWILHNETGADALLLILGCLDINKVTKDEFNEMRVLVKDYENSLAEKVVACLCHLVSEFELSISEIKNNKTSLCEEYTERVYNEVLNLVSSQVKRKLKFRTCIPLCPNVEEPDGKSDISNQYLYTFTEKQTVEKWLQITDRSLWGWSSVLWGSTKIVIVGGVFGKATGMFWQDVRVYDTLRKEWIEHGVSLPKRRHAGVAILEDSLFLVGGTGSYRIVLDTAIIYDLRQRTHRKIANFPNAIQSPAVCVHNNRVYAAGQNNIYRYEECGEVDQWKSVLETNLRPTCMKSHKGYIYCIQNFQLPLYRFRPDVDQNLDLIGHFTSLPSSLFTSGDRLLGFTRITNTQMLPDTVNIEEYTENSEGGQLKVVWSMPKCNFTINEVAGVCVVLDTVPPVKPEVSTYLRRYLTSYK